MEQLAVQRPSITPMVEQLSATSILATSIPPMGQRAQQLGLIAPAPRKRLPDIPKFDGS